MGYTKPQHDYAISTAPELLREGILLDKPLLLKLHHGFIRLNNFASCWRMDQVQVDVATVHPEIHVSSYSTYWVDF
jgi:hypothetical protein